MRSSSRSRSRPPPRAARRSTTCCSPARPGSARPRSRRSSPPSSTSRSCRRPGPALERKGDIAAFLTALEPRAVFFVDEIHRLPRALEETFYPGDGGRPAADHGRPGRGRARRHARPAAVHAVGATTRAGPADDAAARPLRHPAPPRALRRRRPRARSSRRSARHPRRRDRRRRRARRSPRAAAARRASPTGCSSACATTPRCAATASSTADAADAALDLLEVDHEGLDRLDREILRAICDEVRRRPGRALDARGRRRRGAGHDRGRLRALPAAARAARAHAARARRHRRAPSSTSGSSRPAEQPRCSERPRRAVARRRIARARDPYPSRGESMAHLFICPNCGNRSAATDRTAGFRAAPKGCAKCGFGFLFELLDDYYPAPDAAFFVCDQRGPRDRLRPRLVRADRPRRRAVIGRPVREVLGLDFDDGDGPRRHRARVGRARARQAGRRSTPRAICPPARPPTSSRLRRRRRPAARPHAADVSSCIGSS